MSEPTPSYKWENVSVRVDRWKRLQALCEELEPHQHYDGQNECQVCDELLTDMLVRHCEKLAAMQKERVIELGRECLHCGGIHPITAMYRCFDCNAWLCEDCTRGHMAQGREPHPKLRDQFIVELAELKRQRDELERTLAAQRTALLALSERIRLEGMQGVSNEIEEIIK